MVDRLENLKDLAFEHSTRSPAKLQKQAVFEGVRVSTREAQEALRTDLGRQVFGPKPRSRGKSAAEGPKDRLQFDLTDFSNNTSKKSESVRIGRNRRVHPRNFGGCSENEENEQGQRGV